MAYATKFMTTVPFAWNETLAELLVLINLGNNFHSLHNLSIIDMKDRFLIEGHNPILDSWSDFYGHALNGEETEVNKRAESLLKSQVQYDQMRVCRVTLGTVFSRNSQ